MAETGDKGKGKRKGCFKVSCLGCVAIVGVAALIVGIFAAVILTRGPHEPVMEQRKLTQAVPAAAVELPSPIEDEDRSPGPTALAVPVDEPGRVILDVQTLGRFFIEPGPPGEPIRVEAEYDTGAFKLEQTFEGYGETGWTYRLDFHRTVSWLGLIGVNDVDNEIRLILPRDTPILLEGSIGMGISDIELGGLWLIGADLEVGMGDHFIGFDQPLPVPSGPLRFKGSTGSLRISRVGNASPSSVEIEHGMGDMELDLRGPWVRDATIAARCSMGSCRIRVPEGVRLDLQKATVSMGEKNLRGLRNLPEPPDGAPTLTLSLSARMGELRVER